MKRLRRALFIWQVDENRKDDCKKYEVCLDIASTANWKSFSCKGCEQYIPGDKPDIGELVQYRNDISYPPSGSFRGNKELKKQLSEKMAECGMDRMKDMDEEW